VKYRPHRPRRRKYYNFQVFRAGGTITGIDRHGMVTDRSHMYRPRIDRLEMVILQGFSSPLVVAVGAVGILTGPYGCISVMQANGACYQVIPRG
jgi:hypothetical protein